MATRGVPALPADGGASLVAGWSSGEIAVAALGVFLVFYVLAAITRKDWTFDVAFLSLVAGGLLVTWPVMILMTGSAVMVAVVVGVAHKLLARDKGA